MKKIFIVAVGTLLFLSVAAQKKAENIIIITTDGFRWQELFGGLDTTLAYDPAFNQGAKKYLSEKYGAETAMERRKKLMPFFWEKFAAQGQIHGNRLEGSKVNNANPYWFSYPGYSEIFCGYADTLINSNGYKANPNVNVLEYINSQPKYKNKVAAFGAWDAFDRILNEQRSGFAVFSAFDTITGKSSDPVFNAMLRDSHKPWDMGECLDVYTQYGAMQYLKINKPKVLYIAYGETDEWAHAGYYKYYMDAAHNVDKWLKDLYTYLQSDPQYRNNTAIFFTSDHGRGDKVKSEWTDHGSDVVGADQIWFAAMGPGIAASGESKKTEQFYQKQFAQTMASLLGLKFVAPQPIAAGIDLEK